MRIQITSLLVALFMTLALSASNAKACSIMFPADDDISDLFADAVSNQLGVDKSQVEAGLTSPQVTFLQPLGADCSGIETGFFSASYSFEFSNATSSCKAQGVAILKGITLSDEVVVNDSTACIGNPLPPMHYMAGQYLNMNQNPNHIKRVAISDDAKMVRVWGACGGGECDWGYTPLRKTGEGSWRAIFSDRIARRVLRLIEGVGGAMDLEIHSTTTYPDGRVMRLIESFERM